MIKKDLRSVISSQGRRPDDRNDACISARPREELSNSDNKHVNSKGHKYDLKLGSVVEFRRGRMRLLLAVNNLEQGAATADTNAESAAKSFGLANSDQLQWKC